MELNPGREKKNQEFREHAFSVSQSYFSLWTDFIIIFSAEKFYLLLCQHGWQKPPSQNYQSLHGAKDWLTGALIAGKESVETGKKEKRKTENQWPIGQHQLATFMSNWCPRRKVGGIEEVFKEITAKNLQV